LPARPAGLEMLDDLAIEPQAHGLLGDLRFGAAGDFPAHLLRKDGKRLRPGEILVGPQGALVVRNAELRLHIPTLRYLAHFLCSFACARRTTMMRRRPPRSVKATTYRRPSSSTCSDCHRCSP